MRVGKLHEVPQLAHMVLQRRARQQQPEVSLQCHGHPGHLRLLILDGVRFVKHDGMPRAGTESLLLRDEQSVGRDHHVESPSLPDHALAVFPGAIEQADVEFRSKACRLLLPVEDERGGHDDQLRSLLGPAQQQRERLYGLSQTHVIGQQCPRSPHCQP